MNNGRPLDPPDVSERLASFISRSLLSNSHASVALEDRLFEEGLIDSLGILELVAFIEDSFGITVRDLDVDLENFGSIGAIRDFVIRRAGEAAP